MKPNMTIDELHNWIDTDAFAEYRTYRGPQQVDSVISRTERVLKGTATESDREKTQQFIARMKNQNAGKRQFGSGRSKVSARTAALKNWGYDPNK